jgi:hypothetical protein
MPFETQPHLPIKRPREESDPESETDDMDFHHTENITPTQALGDTDANPDYLETNLPPPLTPEHAALRADIQMITGAAMENLYNRIIIDSKKAVEDTVRKVTNQLQGQILSLNARISQLQQQLLASQAPTQAPAEVQVVAQAKKTLRLKLSKKNAGADGAGTATPATTENTPQVSSTIPPTPAVNTRGWETIPSGGRKMKATPAPKLIPTKYPQTEREVTCHFHHDDGNGNTRQPEKTYVERQKLADVALHRINTAFVDNKDVHVPPFIRARVTTRGSIVFTTGYSNSNVVYEDYVSIIIDALSYYGTCEKVEIGKRFSQFLLHGVPTHLSIDEISNSIKTNYPQLIQGQTPRWLTPADRREYKANSTIVMTLLGNVKKIDIGRQNLIVGNRECQLDDYISFGRSTQCRKCQTYGHPAALCQNDPRCAVCAESHETRQHPCTLPACKKGPTCTHPPIRCANCGTPHKASDPNCPERIKLRSFNKATVVANQGDAPMAGVTN